MLQGDGRRAYPVWWGVYPVVYDCGAHPNLLKIRQRQLDLVERAIKEINGRNPGMMDENDVKLVQQMIKPAYGEDHANIRPDAKAALQRLQADAEKLIEALNRSIILPTDVIIGEINRGRKRTSTSPPLPGDTDGKKRAKTTINFDDPELLKQLKPIVHDILDEPGSFPVKDAPVIVNNPRPVNQLKDGRLSTQSDQLQKLTSLVNYTLEKLKKLGDENEKQAKDIDMLNDKSEKQAEEIKKLGEKQAIDIKMFNDEKQKHAEEIKSLNDEKEKQAEEIKKLNDQVGLLRNDKAILVEQPTAGESSVPSDTNSLLGRCLDRLLTTFEANLTSRSKNNTEEHTKLVQPN